MTIGVLGRIGVALSISTRSKVTRPCRCRPRPCKAIGLWPSQRSASESMPCAAGAGVEHIGHQHRVVEAGDVDAVALHHQLVDISGSAPTFRTDAVFQQRFQPRQRVPHRDLVLRQPAAEQIAGAVLVPERHIGARIEPRVLALSAIASEKPTSSACIASSEVVSVSKATRPVSPRLGNPVVERREVADASHRLGRSNLQRASGFARGLPQARPVLAPRPLLRPRVGAPVSDTAPSAAP